MTFNAFVYSFLMTAIRQTQDSVEAVMVDLGWSAEPRRLEMAA